MATCPAPSAPPSVTRQGTYPTPQGSTPGVARPINCDPATFARLEQILRAHMEQSFYREGDFLCLHVEPIPLAESTAIVIASAFRLQEAEVERAAERGARDEPCTATDHEFECDESPLPASWASEPVHLARVYQMGRRMAADFTTGLLYDRTLPSLRRGLRAQRDYAVRQAVALDPRFNSRERGEAEWYDFALTLARAAENIDEASELIYTLIRNT